MEENEIKIVESRPLPRALSTLIDSSNKTLLQLQQQLKIEIEESATELMTMLELTYEDGWRLDLENQQWVRIELIEDDAS